MSSAHLAHTYAVRSHPDGYDNSQQVNKRNTGPRMACADPRLSFHGGESHLRTELLEQILHLKAGDDVPADLMNTFSAPTLRHSDSTERSGPIGLVSVHAAPVSALNRISCARSGPMPNALGSRDAHRS
jgi:hypothetical protein